MRRQLALFFVLIVAAKVCHADVPKGFRWINIETDKSTMTVVRQSLRGKEFTAIREVGVQGDFALVMTASRETEAPTPDYDLWSIYNVSLADGKTQLLVSGYGVKLLDWIGVFKNELAITYYDCWECEAATLFTTLHISSLGWQARWPNKTAITKYPQPGAIILMTDLEDGAQQVAAVIAQPNKSFAVGTWVQSSRPQTGKPEDTVMRYTFDPQNGSESSQTLTGPQADRWKRDMCNPSKIVIEPAIGQTSKACQRITANTR